MNKITVVGLGPGDSKYLTMEAIEVLNQPARLLLRTEKHPTVEYLREKGIDFMTFDDLYETCQTFDEVYEKIAYYLLEEVKLTPVIYAVPGNPFVAERTVELLKERYENIEYIYGVSFIDVVLTVLRIDPVNGLAVVDGLNIKKISNDTNNIIIQVYNKMVAADVKYKLSEYYEDEQEIYIVKSAGIKNQEFIKKVCLWELDHEDIFDHLTTLVIEPVEEGKRRKSYDDLIEVMRVLRSEDGCPWDRKQTHETLRTNLIEEAYEVLEAIDNGDSELLEEELGDLLLQVVFHGLIEEEMGYFNLVDVTHHITEKLIRRHPHVFGELAAETAEDVEIIWNGVKKNEKNQTYAERMESVSKSSPSLIRAYKIQNIAREIGFDWDDVYPAIDKVKEELAEIIAEIEALRIGQYENELGDLLFAVVNVARLLKIDPEIALDKTNQKFTKRFKYIEESALAKQKGLDKMSLQEMDFLWEEAKKTKNNDI
ncbi:MAG: nucleoside triphosphate pyrophosphohydrolase [Clostridiales bacterium]|nr:nucleoside triphosphate pyrophosphohydrolase [Clostridiales bacterium]